jgi:hypothetical protein
MQVSLSCHCHASEAGGMLAIHWSQRRLAVSVSRLTSRVRRGSVLVVRLHRDFPHSFKEYTKCDGCGVYYLGSMDHDEQPSQTEPPTGIAFGVCIILFSLIYILTKQEFSQLENWWVKMFISLFIPNSLSFLILYRSSWRREMSRMARTLFLIWQSFIIFICALTMILIVIISYWLYFYNYGCFHS